MRPSALRRRQLARGLVLLVVLSLLSPAAVSAATYDPSSASEFRRGTIDRPADGITVVSIQGFHFRGQGSEKKPARLVAFGSRGDVLWIHNGSEVGARWFYDTDPLDNGNLLVLATEPRGTLVYELDTTSREIVWLERLPFTDTHDVDLLDDGRLLVANMRNYNDTTGENDDRILLYNRTTDTVEWEWLFREQGFPRTGGGRYTDDWTHVNDVDALEDGRFLVSVRNFDQVIVVDPETGEIDLQLGADDDHDMVYEQHNPQYLESQDGTPTILVADSENDRVVEYEQGPAGEWEKTWEVRGGFSWARDADRLPSGNTLIVDSLNHRVVEVTPTGKIVWEVYAPWGPYDAERVELGDESGFADDLPTTRDLGSTGSYQLSGSAGLEPGTGDRLTFAQRLEATFSGTPLDGPARWFAARWAHVTPWIYPAWMTGWEFAGVVAAVLVVLGWTGVEAAVERRRIAGFLRRHVPRR